jgi:hypothetical protein
LVEPKDEEAQQVYVADSIRVSIEDSKKEAFAAQIINDCYGFCVAEKMFSEENPELEFEFTLYICILHVLFGGGGGR